LAIALTV